VIGHLDQHALGAAGVQGVNDERQFAGHGRQSLDCRQSV
jgi:hypothetical protein